MQTFVVVITFLATLSPARAWNHGIFMSIVNDRATIRLGKPSRKSAVALVAKTLQSTPNTPQVGFANELSVLTDYNEDAKNFMLLTKCILNQRENCNCEKRSICPLNGRECDENRVDLHLQYQSIGKGNKPGNAFSTFDASSMSDGYLKRLASMEKSDIAATPPFCIRERLFSEIKPPLENDQPWSKIGSILNVVVTLIRYLIDPFHRR